MELETVNVLTNEAGDPRGGSEEEARRRRTAERAASFELPLLRKNERGMEEDMKLLQYDVTSLEFL